MAEHFELDKARNYTMTEVELFKLQLGGIGARDLTVLHDKIRFVMATIEKISSLTR